MENVYKTPSESCDVTKLQNFWANVADDQIASGIGAEKFCQQHQINFSQFHYWKYRKIKPNFSNGNDISKPRKKQGNKDAAKFISLQIAADIPSNENLKDRIVDVQDKTVEILFKNGHKMILPLAISETNLLLLIKIVAGQQC
jgi:hypothetical protein